MTYKTPLFALLFSVVTLSSETADAFVHISSRKPHLPLSPERPTLTFQWNGDAPNLSEKEKILDGQYANSSDAELMEALLELAASKWSDVEGAYLDFDVVVNAGVITDNEDEIYAIVVESQDSKNVAAAALPTFVSERPDESANKKSGKIIFDCDISVSSAKVTAKQLLRTLVHEMGHCMGLGHPHSNYHSIMSYSSLSDSAELGLDDKAGVSFLYPEPGVSQDVKYLTSCGSIAHAEGSGPLSLALMLSPLLLLVFRTKKSSQPMG